MLRNKVFIALLLFTCIIKILNAQTRWENSRVTKSSDLLNYEDAAKSCSKQEGRLVALKNRRIFRLVLEAIGTTRGKK